ncbi:MAG: hypothetical protein HDR83_01920 [Bacteroides sp.]|nr:hypothetical protein [Bacteroidales bacterium]MBD5254337.1 hypothetical protein [Barnesiella sp.]MBD5343600.1 hypothetical protein [Bacteroides sp.]MBD5368006.1 hypothetical protein [Bacteroides sp.]
MPFDPNNISLYSITDLIGFINSGEVTFDELRQIGVNYLVQDQIRKFLAEKDIWAMARQSRQGIDDYLAKYPDGFFVGEADMARAQLEDDETWRWAESRNTPQSYRTYLNRYPQGAHSFDAKMNIDMLEAELVELKAELFADMKESPWKYRADDMRNFYNGVDLGDDNVRNYLQSQGGIGARFLLKGMTITHQDLIDNGVVPESFTQTDVMSPEFSMPQTKIDLLGDYPRDRTDVFFLGVPRSGKSSVLAGMLYQLRLDGNGRYVPHMVDGIDPCMAYYNGLIRSVGTKKPPVGTATDTVSFMQIEINDGRRQNDLSIVEMAGEAFQSAANRISDTSMRGVWEQLGAETILRNDNRKMLFFVLDYSTIKGINQQCTEQDQLLTLESALRTLCYDGPNPSRPQEGCTMSRVETVAIILTKSDLMGKATVAERMAEAQRYLTTNFRAFLKDLEMTCKQYGCNKANDYRLYFLTFSLGNFYVGNTFEFNPTDSREIINFIKTVTPSRSVKRFGIF